MHRLIFCADPHWLDELATLDAIIEDDKALLHRDVDAALAEVRERAVSMALVDPRGGEAEAFRLLAGLRSLERKTPVPILLVCAADDREVRSRALEYTPIDFLATPIDPFEFRTRVSTLTALAAATARVNRLEGLLQEAVTGLEDARRESEAELLTCLLRAAAYRDSVTGNHLVRIGHFSKLIAQNMGLPLADVELLLKAAPMHDVGKIALPDSALHASAGASEEVQEIAKLHTLQGYAILRVGESPLLKVAAEIALSHHEHYDGTGFPNGLAGEDIPLFARIVAVADSFDVLAFDPLLEPPEAMEQARAYLQKHAGTHFDPRVVAALLADQGQIDAILNLVA